MSDYEQIFHKQELYDMLAHGEVKSLDDLYSIEDVALSIQKLQSEIDFLKGYKKKKQQDIDSKINSLSSKIDFFKRVVIQTLKEHKEKSVDFPGTCKVVTRNQSSSWGIVDEEGFIKAIEQAEEDGETVDGVVEEVVERVIRKKPAKKLLDTWNKNGNLEKYFPDDGPKSIERTPPKTTVSFSFSKKEDEEGPIDETVPSKEEVEGAFDSV